MSVTTKVTSSESLSRFKCAKSFVKNSLVALASTVSLVFKTLSFNKAKIENAYISTKEKWQNVFARRKVVVITPMPSAESNPPSPRSSKIFPAHPSIPSTSIESGADVRNPSLPSILSNVSRTSEGDFKAPSKDESNSPVVAGILSPAEITDLEDFSSSEEEDSSSIKGFPSPPSTSCDGDVRNPNLPSILRVAKPSEDDLKAHTKDKSTSPLVADSLSPTEITDLRDFRSSNEDKDKGSHSVREPRAELESFKLAEDTTLAEIELFFNTLFHTDIHDISFSSLQKLQACKNRLKHLLRRCSLRSEKHKINSLIQNCDNFIKSNFALRLIKSITCYQKDNLSDHTKLIDALDSFEFDLNFQKIRSRKVLKKIYKELTSLDRRKDNIKIKQYLQYWDFIKRSKEILNKVIWYKCAASPQEVDELVDALKALTFLIDETSISKYVENINDLITNYNVKALENEPCTYYYNYGSHPRRRYNLPTIEPIKISNFLSLEISIRELENELKSISSITQIFQFRKQIWEAAQQADDYLKDGGKLRWVSGSNSASIPIIRRTAQSIFGLSLVPTGKLVALANLAPLSGELYWGVSSHGINQHSLSGVTPYFFSGAVRYANEKSFIFSPPQQRKEILKKLKEFIELDNASSQVLNEYIRLRIGILRLLMTGQEAEHYPSIIKYLKRLAKKFPIEPEVNYNPQHLPLLGKEVPTDLLSPIEECSIGDIVGVSRSSGMISFGLIVSKNLNYFNVVVEPDGTSKYVEAKYLYRILATENLADLAEREKNFEENLAFFKFTHAPIRKKIEDLITLFSTVKPLQFEALESELIQKSFPIIWGSRNLKGTYFKSDIRGEHCIRGKAELISDIQVIFTNAENIPLVQRALPHQIHVLTFDAANYIRCVQEYEKISKKKQG